MLAVENEVALRNIGTVACMSPAAANRLKIPQAFWRALELLDVRPAVVLRQACLPPTLHHQPGWLITTDQLFDVWTAVETITADAAFSLKLLRAFDESGHQPAYLAAGFANSYRDGLIRLDRFKRLGACEKFVFKESRGYFSMYRSWPCRTKPEPSISVQMSFAFWVDLGRRGTGRQINPVRIRLQGRGRVADELRDYFRCPIERGKDGSLVTMNSIDLDRPFAARNAEFLEILTPALMSSLNADVGQDALTEQVKRSLKARLPSGRPELADVARALAMSERTLQRRITDEGTTFRALLLEARQELGRRLVSDTSVEVDEVAFLLGYQDTSSFYRAFKEWEGMTPSQWRAESANAC